jgi:hypothetical protein
VLPALDDVVALDAVLEDDGECCDGVKEGLAVFCAANGDDVILDVMADS